MNLPNALTLLRIVMVPMFLYKVLQGEIYIATLIYIVAAVTDGLDGFIARFWNMQTKLGAFIDPLADKLLVTTSFVVLAALKYIPLWIAVAVISRDVIITLGSLTVYLMKQHLTVKPHPVGKITTFFQFSYLLIVLIIASRMTSGTVSDTGFLISVLRPVEVCTGFLTVISGVIYIIAGFRVLEE